MNIYDWRQSARNMAPKTRQLFVPPYYDTQIHHLFVRPYSAKGPNILVLIFGLGLPFFRVRSHSATKEGVFICRTSHGRTPEGEPNSPPLPISRHPSGGQRQTVRCRKAFKEISPPHPAVRSFGPLKTSTTCWLPRCRLFRHRY